jgi:uncharacterized MnhB-related membrane protein
MRLVMERAGTAEPRWGPVRRGARATRRPSTLDIVVFVGIVILGLARVPGVFTGDQALNMLMGKVIASGGVPYVDLWDLKHPGIFLFFAAGGSLFGFTEVGLHLFELIWMLLLAVIVRLVAADVLESRIAASLAPALTVGFYYVAADAVHMTQTEALVGLPLLGTLVAATIAVRPGVERPRSWVFVSGLCAGAVIVFKAPYVLLVAVFWLLALVELRRTTGETLLAGTRRWALPAAVGLLFPVASCILYLASMGALDEAMWTFTVHPREAAAETTIVDLQLLFDSTASFVRIFGVLLALAAIGTWVRLRRGWDVHSAAFVAWLGVGLVLCWAQVIGWYTYHYFLVLVPMGMLATVGGEAVWRAMGATSGRLGRVTAAAILIAATLATVPSIVDAGGSVIDVAEARPLPFDANSARRFQAAHDPGYGEDLDMSSFLRRPGHPGSVYVFGNPLTYVLAERPPAISVLATWFHPTEAIWDRMVRELQAAVPAYVLIEDGGLEFFTDHNPDLADEVLALQSWLEDRYERFRSGEGWTWYARRGAADPPPA